MKIQLNFNNLEELNYFNTFITTATNFHLGELSYLEFYNSRDLLHKLTRKILDINHNGKINKAIKISINPNVSDFLNKLYLLCSDDNRIYLAPFLENIRIQTERDINLTFLPLLR